MNDQCIIKLHRFDTMQNMFNSFGIFMLSNILVVYNIHTMLHMVGTYTYLCMCMYTYVCLPLYTVVGRWYNEKLWAML